MVLINNFVASDPAWLPGLSSEHVPTYIIQYTQYLLHSIEPRTDKLGHLRCLHRGLCSTQQSLPSTLLSASGILLTFVPGLQLLIESPGGFTELVSGGGGGGVLRATHGSLIWVTQETRAKVRKHGPEKIEGGGISPCSRASMPSSPTPAGADPKVWKGLVTSGLEGEICLLLFPAQGRQRLA